MVARSKTFYVIVLLLLATLFGAASAQSEASYGGTLRVAITGDPPTLDQHISTAVIVLEISSHIVEGLYARDADGQVQPMLAAAAPNVSADGLTYTIPLRSGVTFHDGSDFDAKDVVASLERWGRIGYGKAYLPTGTQITALDDLTVQIVLPAPVGILASVLGWTEGAAPIYSSEQLASAGDAAIDTPIGTGPYVLREWIKGQKVVLERYADYASLAGDPSGDVGAKRAYLDVIEFVAVPDAATRQAGLESGEFDVNYRASASDLAFINASNNMYSWMMKPGYNYIGIINHASPLMQNVELRRALQAAIDVYPLALGAFGDDSVFAMSASIIPREYGAMFNDTAGTELYANANLERAKEILAGANYDGTPVRWLTSRDYDYQYRGTLIAVDQVSGIGLNSEIIVRDWATTVAMRSDPEQWDIFIGNFTIAPEPEMISYLNPNYLNHYEGTERYQQLRAELLRTTEQSARQALWADMQEEFFQDVGALQMVNAFLLNAYSSKVHVDARYFLFQAWNTWKE